MVRGCVHLLNKNNCLWHCDITYKSVVRNLYVVGKVVLGCKKVGNHYYKLPTRLRRFGWISDTETDYVQLPQGEFLYRTHSNRIPSLRSVSRVGHKANILITEVTSANTGQLSNCCLSEMQHHIAQTDNAIDALATSPAVSGQSKI
jgi:hypothetical protein